MKTKEERLEEFSINPHPYKVALELTKSHLTVREYEELQQERLRRWIFFKSKNISGLIESSKHLYEWGEKVLVYLKAISKNEN